MTPAAAISSYHEYLLALRSRLETQSGGSTSPATAELLLLLDGCDEADCRRKKRQKRQDIITALCMAFFFVLRFRVDDLPNPCKLSRPPDANHYR